MAVTLVNYVIRFLFGGGEEGDCRARMYILLKSKQFSINFDNVISGIFTNNVVIKQLLMQLLINI